MSSFSFISGTKKPWVSISCKPITQQDIPDDILLLKLDGSTMGTLEEMYQEFCSVFHFPDYFGKNFNALDECLTDLEWLPANGYLLSISNAEYFLGEETDDILEGVFSILNDVGEEWATPVISGQAWDREEMPFHTILEVNKNNALDFYQKLKKLGIKDIEV
jgi:RNAse (barnase) inhibitor barstar